MPQQTYLSAFTEAEEDAYDFECEMRRDFEEDYEGELDQADFEHDLEDSEDGLDYEGDN